MKKITHKAGKTDPKALGMAVLLVAALGGVYFSYRMTNAPGTAKSFGPTTSQAQVTSFEAMDRLIKSIETHLQEDAEKVRTDWVVAAAPVAPVVKTPSAVAKTEDPTFKLRGVVNGGQQPIAFINETTVGLGETILGSRVKAITNDSVTLVDGQGKEHVLSLYQN